MTIWISADFSVSPVPTCASWGSLPISRVRGPVVTGVTAELTVTLNVSVTIMAVAASTESEAVTVTMATPSFVPAVTVRRVPAGTIAGTDAMSGISDAAA